MDDTTRELKTTNYRLWWIFAAILVMGALVGWYLAEIARILAEIANMQLKVTVTPK